MLFFFEIKKITRTTSHKRTASEELREATKNGQDISPILSNNVSPTAINSKDENGFTGMFKKKIQDAKIIFYFK